MTTTTSSPPQCPLLRSDVWHRVLGHLRPPLQPPPPNTILNYVDAKYPPLEDIWESKDSSTRLWILHPDVCPQCLNVDIRVNCREGFTACGRCGLVHSENLEAAPLDQHLNGTSLRIVRKGKRTYALTPEKRLAHFRQWLNRLQAKNECSIDKEHLALIEKELSKHKTDALDFCLMRGILRKLKMQRYYGHTYYLICHFGGPPVIELTKDHENVLLQRFYAIQDEFARSRGKRTNMLSYPYLIKKFMELEGWTDAAASIRPFKSNDRLRSQDRVWKKICASKGFVFHSTAY